MIFAELEYQDAYEDFHPELVAFLSTQFSTVQSGLQGDSWIWIFDGEERVSVDTFTSMTHQIKSPKAGQHVQNVIAALQLRYKAKVYETPEFDGHEDV